MSLPPQYYSNLRRQYYLTAINLIFLLESPPSSDNYFYNKNGEVTESLFTAIMNFFNIHAESKEDGLKEFCKEGYLLVYAIHFPIQNIKIKYKYLKNIWI